MYYVGIDIGASSVKVAAVDAAGVVVRVLRRVHQGSPLPCLQALLDELANGENEPGPRVAPEAGGRAGGEGACESEPAAACATSAMSRPLPLGSCGGVAVTGSGAGMVRALAPGHGLL